jgi:hypothetical protein
MTRRSRNTQMFALKDGPPASVDVDGGRYVLKRVFKHDFWAATCLYSPADEGGGGKAIVVKFGRDHSFCGLPIGFYGRWLAAHERAIYARCRGVRGIPRCLGAVGDSGIAIEHVDAVPLDHVERAPEGFFEALREVFDAIHARGVAYCDGNKKSNILVAGTRPVLIDFQIAIATRDDLPWPLRAVVAAAVRYMSRKDLYFLYKHKRKCGIEPLTAEEKALGARPVGLHRLHAKLTKPYRALRRRFLRSRHESGLLTSPSAEMEDHYQPEKETWRAPVDKRANNGQ